MRTTPPLLLAATLFATTLHGCQSSQNDASPAPPHKSCTSAIWARPASLSSTVAVTGAWDSWATPTVLGDYGTSGWKVGFLTLPPGEYGYQIIDAGVARSDELQPLTTFHGETEVSLLRVDDCHQPSLSIQSVTTRQDGSTQLKASFLAADDGAALSFGTVTTGVAGETITADPARGTIDLTLPAKPRGKTTGTLRAGDSSGREATARVALWSRPAHDEWSSGILYQIMLDRFRGDGGSALPPPKTPGSRAGGTLDGVRAELEQGTFDELGVTALWLSPVYTNPDEARLGSDGHLYEAYHGYWPLASREVDPRLGGEAALHAVVAAAHARGIRVLLDIVPNHVYEKNPRYLQNLTDGMFHTGKDDCICGAADCDWGAHILSCWFADYLPDVRYEDDDAMKLAVADAAWFHDTFDIDGVRIDAVPMMPRAATRRIVSELRTTVAPRGARFTIGEVYTGPGIEGVEQIKYELGPDGLDAAFDFPLMWALRDTVASGVASWETVDALLQMEDVALSGSGSLLGRIIGNHDTTRFASESLGDGAQDPWTAPPPSPLPPDVYARQLIALTFALTIPGLPVLYYGDEVALTGGADPGSRRVMPSLSSLSTDAALLRSRVATLGRLRSCSSALRRGARTLLASTSTTTSYLRQEQGKGGSAAPVLVLLSLAAVESSLFVGAAAPAGDYVDVLSGDLVTLAGGPAATVTVPALSARVLLPAGDACIHP